MKTAFNAYFSFILSKVLTAHKYLQPYSLERLQHDYDAKIASSTSFEKLLTNSVIKTP